MSDPAAFDAPKIVEILERHHVDYVLVGGFAAVLYGARRPTEDVDIAPATTADNLDRLSRALREPKARIRVDGIQNGLAFDTSAEALRGMTMLNLRTAYGDCDLTFAPAGFRVKQMNRYEPVWRSRCCGVYPICIVLDDAPPLRHGRRPGWKANAPTPTKTVATA